MIVFAISVLLTSFVYFALIVGFWPTLAVYGFALVIAALPTRRLPLSDEA